MLTTNAAKYGALTLPSGRIRVSCVEGNERLLLAWKEHGGPVLDGAPRAEGFGSKLARQTVSSQFGGAISYGWNRQGLTVELVLQRDRLAH